MADRKLINRPLIAALAATAFWAALPATAAVPVEESRPSGGSQSVQSSSGAAAAFNAAPAAAPSDGAQNGGFQAGEPGRFSEMFYELQVLRQEVQELRGLVEEQNHRLDRLARDQQEQYLDLDRRLQALRNGGGGGSAEPSGGAGDGDEGARPSLPAGGSGSGAGGERQAYADAIELMRNRQFEASADAFNQLVAEYPNGQYTPNAFYWLGELYLAQDDFEKARQSFAQVINLYPDHHKVPDALFKLGLVYERLGDLQRAREYLVRVRDEFPQSDAAGLARNHLAEL